MENKVIGIEVNVDANGAIKTLGDLEKETEKFNEELKKTSQGASGLDNVEKAFTDLNAKVESGEMSMRDYTKAIKQYQTIALQAGETSPIGADAIQKAAALRDRLGDLNTAINTNAHDGKNMQAALQLGSSVTAGYGVAQGAMALLGEENEDLMKSMVKLQAATSVLTGLEQIRASLEKESFLMQKAKTIQTYALSAATGVYSAVVGTTTGGLKLLRLALISTGIGALIVGVGLLIANFDKVYAAMMWVVDAAKNMFHRFQEMGTGMKILLSIMFPFVGMIWAVTEALEAMGVIESVEGRKSREAIEAKMKISTEAHKKRVDQIKEQIAFVKSQQAAEKAATELALKGISREIELRQAAGLEIKELEKTKLTILINSAQEQYRLAKTLLELQDNELLSRRQHNIDIQNDAGKNTEQLQKALEFEKRQRALNIEENLATEKEALDQALHNLKVFNIQVETDRKNAQSKEKDEEIKHQDEIKRIRNGKIKNIEQENKTIETGQANHWIIMGQLAKEAADKQKAEDEAELARKLSNLDKVKQGTNNMFDFLTNLNTAFGKNSEKAAKRDFKLNKAKNLAEAGVDGTKAVLSTFASTPGGIVIKSAAAVAAGLFAASNIARIASSKFEGGGGGGGSVSLPSTSSGVGGADVGTVSNTTTTIGGDSKVYVTEQDISNTQGRVRVLENQSQL